MIEKLSANSEKTEEERKLINKGEEEAIKWNEEDKDISVCLVENENYSKEGNLNTNLGKIAEVLENKSRKLKQKEEKLEHICNENKELLKRYKLIERIKGKREEKHRSMPEIK